MGRDQDAIGGGFQRRLQDALLAAQGGLAQRPEGGVAVEVYGGWRYSPTSPLRMA
jgi:hypothetical protein